MPARANSGPKKKPTALKILQGNPGRRPINMNEPKPGLPNMEPPFPLRRIAKKLWDKYVPILAKLGVITELDVENFAVACE